MTTASAPASEVPAHVPPELVRPTGLTVSPEFLADPYGFMLGLHKTHPPIFFNPSPYTGHSWVLTKYEDCFHVLRHPEIFTTQGATPFPRDPNNYFRFIPLETDPPEHRKFRGVLDAMVSPKAVAALEDYVRKLANQLIDQFIDRRECEFTQEFARPLPVSVFLDIMGLPQDMRDTFVSWAVGLLHSQDRSTAARCMGEIAAYLQQVIEEKRQKPDGRAISTIVHGSVDGQPLAERDAFGFVFFLFIAGLDTVFATLNNVFLWLAQNPTRRQEIIDQPENINGVVEELLRVFSVTFSGRRLAQDYEMRGVKMRAGDKVHCVLPTANFDPEVFENPFEVNFRRPRKPILAFGGGVHSCMGAHLARLEMKICIQEFLRRIPNFRLKEGAKIEYWPGGVVGPKSLPLTW